MSQKQIVDRLSKLKQLTSQWGIYQHGKLDQPDPTFGYALDDQARALIIAFCFEDSALMKLYLNFINNAGGGDVFYHYFYDNKEGIAPDIRYLASEDALGMAGWALMTTKLADDAAPLLTFILKQAEDWVYVRSMAYLLLGLTEVADGPLEDMLVTKILDGYQSLNDWRWFEKKLVYGDAVIPWALWRRARVRGDQKSLQVATETTKFLLDVCREGNIPAPIGNKGWYHYGHKKSLYDQQPIDAAYMVCCLEEALIATGDHFYLDEAKRWWSWFWGNNTKGVVLIDKNNGCYDGVTDSPEKVNLNQGAESTICYLMAYLAARRLGLVK